MLENENRIWDVIVVGGGAAGLSAALTLARARREVVVVDAGQPRNAPAAGVHALLGLDGIPPAELLARGREEVRRYGGQILDAEVASAVRDGEVLALSLTGGGALRARRLLVAGGLVDVLPDIPGVAERWGRDVLHCPYCHGWEVRDRSIAVLATGPMAVHQTLLFHQWSRAVRLFSNGQVLDAVDRAKLDALGIAVVDGAVAGLEVRDDALHGVRLADGTLVPTDAAVVGPRMVARTAPYAALGITGTEHPMGSFIAADDFGRTAAPGVWVAGNATDLSAQVSAASAEGARVAAQINAELVMQDAERAVAAMAGAGVSE